MKKLLTLALLSALLLPLFSAAAEQGEILPIEKGKAVFTEILDVTSVKASKDRSVFFQVMTKKNLATGDTAYCARLAYKKNSRRERAALLDIDEIDSALETLRYIRDNYAHLQDFSNIEYWSNETQFQTTDGGAAVPDAGEEQDALESLLGGAYVNIGGQSIALRDLIGMEDTDSFQDSSTFRIGLSFAGEKEKDLTLYLYLDTYDGASIPVASIGTVISAFEATKEALLLKLAEDATAKK